MAYNRVNKLKRYLKIVEITQKYYDPDYVKYAAIWRTHIYPVYLISYRTYMEIINTPDIEKQIEEEINKNSNYNEHDAGTV